MNSIFKMNNVLNITSELQMIEHIKQKISTTGFIINKFSEKIYPSKLILRLRQ
jgi:hypothetical protein